MGCQRRASGIRNILTMKWYLIPLLLGATPMNLNSASAGNWRDILTQRLPLYGHRNWIVVVDAAYPAQTSQGIETILCEDSQIDVVRGVLEVLAGAKHVRPTIYLDRELDAVSEKDAPGISEYREAACRGAGESEEEPDPARKDHREAGRGGEDIQGPDVQDEADASLYVDLHPARLQVLERRRREAAAEVHREVTLHIVGSEEEKDGL